MLTSLLVVLAASTTLPLPDPVADPADGIGADQVADPVAGGSGSRSPGEDTDRVGRAARAAVGGALAGAAGAAVASAFLYAEASPAVDVHDVAVFVAAVAAPGLAAIAGGSATVALGMATPAGADFAWVFACTGIGYVMLAAIVFGAGTAGVCSPVLGGCAPAGSGCGGCGMPGSGPSASGPSASESAPSRAALIGTGFTGAFSAAGMAVGWIIAQQSNGSNGSTGSANGQDDLALIATGSIVGGAIGGAVGGAIVGAVSP